MFLCILAEKNGIEFSRNPFFTLEIELDIYSIPCVLPDRHNSGLHRPSFFIMMNAGQCGQMLWHLNIMIYWLSVSCFADAGILFILKVISAGCHFIMSLTCFTCFHMCQHVCEHEQALIWTYWMLQILTLMVDEVQPIYSPHTDLIMLIICTFIICTGQYLNSRQHSKQTQLKTSRKRQTVLISSDQ